MNYQALDGQHLLVFLFHFGWTTVELSKELGIAQPTISRIARGKQLPRRETYDKILALTEKECLRIKEMRDRFIALSRDFA